jgi:diguanylate cyclase (GGDEF)-like protein
VHSKPFDSFLDHAPIPIAILDARLKFVKVNRAMTEADGIAEGAHLGKTVAEVLPNLSKRIQPVLLKVLTTREPAVATIKGHVPAYSGAPARWLAACFPCGESQIAIMALEATDRATGEALKRSNLQLEVAQAGLEQSLLVNEMAHCLQSAVVTEELYRIFGRFAPRLFPKHSGALCVIDSSRNVIESTATWGDSSACEPVFAPDDCWALREGRAHLVRDPKAGMVCPHAARDGQYAQICVPMMAQSAMLGFVHLQSRIDHPAGEPFTEGELRLVQIVAEEMALSLANVGLREILRQQAFRDPLTGLYNRRFLQEALDIELRRAKRKRWPVSLVMIDVDDFKRFNDTYGHSAGDSLLKAVATSLQSSVRSNDVLCRYGGDEFSLVMPEASLEDAILWAGKWRASTKSLSAEWEGKELPCPTVSMGVAAYPACLTSDVLFHEADSALYSAKASGRDQVKSMVSSLSSVRRRRVDT